MAICEIRDRKMNNDYQHAADLEDLVVAQPKMETTEKQGSRMYHHSKVQGLKAH